MKNRSRQRRTSTLEMTAHSASHSSNKGAASSTRTQTQSSPSLQRFKDNPLRQTSSGRLREMARRQRTGVETLTRQARYGFQVESRLAALSALVELERYSNQTMQAIEHAMNDDNPEIRARASELVGTYRRQMPEPIKKRLIALVWDKELIVRRATVKALEYHPDPRAIGPLMGLLGTRDDELRRLVHHTLHALNSQLGPAPRFDGNA